jgi:hypothetical protein
MKNTPLLSLALFALAAPGLAQELDGGSIDKAIPIFFGQTVTDIGDRQQVPNKVYKVVLARGQQFSVTANSTAPNKRWWLALLPPNTRTLGQAAENQVVARHSSNWSSENGLTFTYQVPAAGTYFVWLQFDSPGVNYSLRVTAQGTPIAVPNPTTAGCLTGRVDSITYSLQLIAAGLPDEISIGGVRACPACTVKPPLYPEITNRLESALLSGANVEACHDSTGNIFQLKLVRP